MNTLTATLATTIDDRPSERIVVVDDDPGIREVLSDFLGQHGMRSRRQPTDSSWNGLSLGAPSTWWCWM